MNMEDDEYFNLKNKFITWLSRQVNKRGTFYKQPSIDIIVRTYEKCVQYLHIEDAKYDNVFEYKTLDEFLIVYEKIKESPYFGLRTDNVNGNFYTEHARYIEFYKTFLEQKDLPVDKLSKKIEGNNMNIGINTKEFEEYKTEENSEEEFFNDDLIDLNLKIKEAQVISEKQEIAIETLYGRMKRGKILLQPEYQRKFVWDKKKASNLIESILLNIPIPPIFIAEEDGIQEIVDGQQRLTSICNFIDNKFPDYKKNTITEFKLNKLSCLSDLSGKRFFDLPEEYQNKIMDKALSVIIIKESTNKDVKFEMFNRLNTNITKLNNQELRNCLYRGSYNDFIKEMAQYEPFKKLINRPDYETRMLNEELVLSFFTFLDVDYHQYRGGLKQMMNNNMVKNRNIEKKYLVEKEEKFKKSIDLIKMIFKENEAFRIFSLDKKTNSYKFEKTKINQGLWLILMYWFSMYSKNQIITHLDIIREELLNLQIHHEKFIGSLTGSGTNSPSEMLTKFNIWGETLQNILGLPKNEPRCFSYELKQQLFNQNPICAICGNKINCIDDADVDHITCYSKGGLTIPENARLTHRYCNQQRGNRD